MRAKTSWCVLGVLCLASTVAAGCAGGGGGGGECGNGTIEEGEACDDGEANSDTVPDACREDCDEAHCGDGVVDSGEQCDDGNAVGDDACANDCTRNIPPGCGNGTLDEGEACDDGEANSDTEPDACRLDCTAPRCGDRVRDTGEQCDDGNAVDDDGCHNDCTSDIPSTCGDGVLDEGEECDDGDANSDTEPDACRETCVEAHCGDHVTDMYEGCDDGNTFDNDSCLPNCMPAVCGDGAVYAGVEECDDANTDNTDACLITCVVARCGDGFVQTGVEECDDANRDNTDTCLSTCEAATCGDGFQRAGLEECDDGNVVDTDACPSTCTRAECGDGFVEAGFEECDDGNDVETDACLSTCVAARCGDGIVRFGVEDCDDTNDVDTDACLSTCVAARCGDGVIQSGVEECDDGNGVDTDDCTSTCVPASCGDGFVHDGVEECDDGNDVDTDDCPTTCIAAFCGDGFVLEGVEACDDGNESDADDCLSDCVEAYCGDGIVNEGVEECDEGEENGSSMTDACSEECASNSRYERVLSMDAGGVVTFGDWASAFSRVARGMEDCLVRFDGRVARPEYVEHTSASLRFDFQPLSAYHNSWDAYAFVLLENGTRAGVGAAYRRGHDDNVWMRSRDQYSDASWNAMPVDLFCERRTAYEHVASFDASGVATFGSWDALFAAAVTNAARCKVRFDIRADDDARVHPISHLEWGEGWINFDFQGLYASHDTWDAYAYFQVQNGSRAGVGGSYHRGTWGSIQGRDRTQHPESEWHAMAGDIYCADVYDDVYEVAADGSMTRGDWDTLYTAVTEQARDCRIVYDNRISDPENVEYDVGFLQFDFANLHAYYDSWDAYALVDIAHGSAAGLRSNFRRGNPANVWMRGRIQHDLYARTAMPLVIRCEPESSWRSVFSINRAGTVTSGDRVDVIAGLTGVDTAFECRIRFPGRVTHPMVLDHSGSPMYFDYANLAAYHNGWDAYATVSFPVDGAVGIAASLRRGHADNVWQQDRTQRGLDVGPYAESFDFFCR